jgi:hypothetical protein
MIRISLDLDRPPGVAFDEQPECVSALRHRRGEKKWHAGNDLRGGANIRDNLFAWLTTATGRSGQTDRCGHQLQESSSSHRIIPNAELTREFELHEPAKFV